MSEQEKSNISDEPAVDLEITIPLTPVSPIESESSAGESLSLATSLAAQADLECGVDGIIQGVVDILGSTVAESTGWVPPEAEDGER